MITNGDQEFYVRNMKLPGKAEFCRLARRIVIRPDHFCVWTECFIGKKNQKLFFLFNMWGLVYMSGFTVATLRTVMAISGDEEVLLQQKISIAYLFVGISFASITGSFVLSLVYEISMDITTFDGMRNGRKGVGMRECIGHWEEVFGSRTNWYLWLVPVPAFAIDDDRRLVMAKKVYDRRLEL
jgi:hypothetical protein